MIDIVGGAERHGGVRAVHRGRRRIEQVAAGDRATAFQHIEETDQIGIHIGIRVRQRLADAGLGREMHHIGKPVRGKQSRHSVAVGDVQFLEFKRREASQLREPRLLESRIAMVVEIVDADDRASLLEQASRRVHPDEAGRAGHEYWPALHAGLPLGATWRPSLHGVGFDQPDTVRVIALSRTAQEALKRRRAADPRKD